MKAALFVLLFIVMTTALCTNEKQYQKEEKHDRPNMFLEEITNETTTEQNINTSLNSELRILNLSTEAFIIASNHTYKEHEFDCKHFSTAVANKLFDMGYECWCVLGIYRYEGREGLHEWIRCKINNETWNIEPQTAFVFKENSHYTYKKDIDCDFYNRGKRRWRHGLAT